ncbi:hypothetical protein ACRB9V_24415 [Salmonella enterica subsp. enterica serovar Paratyphi A]
MEKATPEKIVEMNAELAELICEQESLDDCELTARFTVEREEHKRIRMTIESTDFYVPASIVFYLMKKLGSEMPYPGRTTQCFIRQEKRWRAYLAQIIIIMQSN